MPNANSALIDRSDTFLGVCEAIGQDLHFNPNYLRVALGVLVLWNPLAMVATYLVLGAIVLASRWIFPPRAEQAAPAEPELSPAANDTTAAPAALAG